MVLRNFPSNFLFLLNKNVLDTFATRQSVLVSPVNISYYNNNIKLTLHKQLLPIFPIEKYCTSKHYVTIVYFNIRLKEISIMPQNQLIKPTI